MASISSVISASSVYAYEAQQNTPKQKPVQNQNPTDVVHLSKAASLPSAAAATPTMTATPTKKQKGLAHRARPLFQPIPEI